MDKRILSRNASVVIVWNGPKTDPQAITPPAFLFLNLLRCQTAGTGVPKPFRSRGPVRKWRLIWAAFLPVNTLFCAFCSFRCEPCNCRIFSAKNTMDRHAARCVRAIRWNRSSVPSEGRDLIRKRRLIWTAVFPVNTLSCAFCSFRFEPSNHRIFSAKDT